MLGDETVNFIVMEEDLTSNDLVGECKGIKLGDFIDISGQKTTKTIDLKYKDKDAGQLFIETQIVPLPTPTMT